MAGKPERPLFEETLTRVGGERPLVIGDRLDTDIEGAVTMGWDSLLVLTGVPASTSWCGAGKRRASDVRRCPTWAALGRPAAAPDGRRRRGRARRLERAVQDGDLAVSGDGSAADWWRVVAVAAWRHLDAHGSACRDRRHAPPR